jgi:hypothetical protein
MDPICHSHRLYLSAIQSETKPGFGDKTYQIVNVYAVLVGAVGIEPTEAWRLGYQSLDKIFERLSQPLAGAIFTISLCSRNFMRNSGSLQKSYQ